MYYYPNKPKAKKKTGVTESSISKAIYIHPSVVSVRGKRTAARTQLRNVGLLLVIYVSWVTLRV